MFNATWMLQILKGTHGLVGSVNTNSTEPYAPHGLCTQPKQEKEALQAWSAEGCMLIV